MQVTSYREIFGLGALPLIHGKSQCCPRIAVQRYSGTAACFFQGDALSDWKASGPIGVPSYGSTGNVSLLSYRLTLTLSQKLMVSSFRSGRGEECTLVR